MFGITLKQSFKYALFLKKNFFCDIFLEKSVYAFFLLYLVHSISNIKNN